MVRLAAQRIKQTPNAHHFAEGVSHVKRILFAALALVAFLSAQSRVSAQSVKPVVVVSLAGYDELMSDVDFIGQITGIPQLSAQMAEEGLKQVTQGQGLKGLDKKKPWGGVLLFDGTTPKFLVFAPVSDVKGLVEAFAGPPFGFSATDAGNGVVELRGPTPQSGFAKTQGSYTFFAQSAADLANLPKDPEGLLDGLNKNYDLAVRAYIQNVPQAFRDQILGGLKMGMQFSLQRPNPGEDPQAFELRKQLVEQQLKQMDTLFKELETFTIGAKIDGVAKSANLDIGLTVNAGSQMAAQLAKVGELKTDHAGFLIPDAAFNMTVVGVVSPEEAQQTIAMVKSLEQRGQQEIDNDSSFPDDATRKTAKEIIGDLVGVAVKTIQSGKIDGGATLFLAPESATLVAGATVADGAMVESALKKFVEMAKSELPEVKLNAGTLNGITLHTMSIPVPDATAQRVFGEAAEVVVGIGAKSVHVAFGRKASDTLKKVVDQSTANAAKTVPPFQMIVSLAPIFKFVNSIEPNPQIDTFANTLSGTPGKDHVSLVAQVEKNGFVYRLKAEEGVLRAIGAAVRTSLPLGAAF
jgi:hypothetical protein